MQFVVKIQYARGPETPVAEFKFLNDAKLFIGKKLQEDAALNVKASYLLCEADEVIDKIDPGKWDISGSQEQTSQGKGQSAAFRPTPLNMTPRPPGTPPKWMREDEDDKEK